MIIKDNTNPQFELLKMKFGLTGDIYVINGHLIESLESHKRLKPDSTATTIEEAEAERLAMIEQEKALTEEPEPEPEPVIVDD